MSEAPRRPGRRGRRRCTLLFDKRGWPRPSARRLQAISRRGTHVRSRGRRVPGVLERPPRRRSSDKLPREPVIAPGSTPRRLRTRNRVGAAGRARAHVAPEVARLAGPDSAVGSIGPRAVLEQNLVHSPALRPRQRAAAYTTRQLPFSAAFYRRRRPRPPSSRFHASSYKAARAVACPRAFPPAHKRAPKFGASDGLVARRSGS